MSRAGRRWRIRAFVLTTLLALLSSQLGACSNAPAPSSISADKDYSVADATHLVLETDSSRSRMTEWSELDGTKVANVPRGADATEVAAMLFTARRGAMWMCDAAGSVEDGPDAWAAIKHDRMLSLEVVPLEFPKQPVLAPLDQVGDFVAVASFGRYASAVYLWRDSAGMWEYGEADDPWEWMQAKRLLQRQFTADAHVRFVRVLLQPGRRVIDWAVAYREGTALGAVPIWLPPVIRYGVGGHWLTRPGRVIGANRVLGPIDYMPQAAP
jgi:hypothetical protein